jgi:hypothetical protein
MLLALAQTFAAACAPGIDNPDRFLDAAVCPTDMQAQFFSRRCGSEGCHVPYEPTGGLDFVSPDVATRLLDIEATTCDGRKLIDREHPEESFILERLSADAQCDGQPILRMPADGNHLNPSEMACVVAWVEAVAGGSDAR